MKPEQLQQLLDSTTVLAEANSKLVDNNSEAIQLVKESITKNDNLNRVALQTYQGLSDKKNKEINAVSQNSFRSFKQRSKIKQKGIQVNPYKHVGCLFF